MTKLEIQLMLEEAADFNFLSAIEFLSSKEKQYTRSDFYKSTKIPLMILFEKFVGYGQLKESQYTLIEKINEFIKGIDTDAIVELLVELIEKAEEKQPIVDTLNQIIENFNYEKVKEYGEEINVAIDKLRK